MEDGLTQAQRAIQQNADNIALRVQGVMRKDIVKARFGQLPSVNDVTLQAGLTLDNEPVDFEDLLDGKEPAYVEVVVRREVNRRAGGMIPLVRYFSLVPFRVLSEVHLSTWRMVEPTFTATPSQNFTRHPTGKSGRTSQRTPTSTSPCTTLFIARNTGTSA